MIQRLEREASLLLKINLRGPLRRVPPIHDSFAPLQVKNGRLDRLELGCAEGTPLCQAARAMKRVLPPQLAALS